MASSIGAATSGVILNRKDSSIMVSNMFAKSLGYGGSSAIKAKSITNGGGKSAPASKASIASNGDLCAAKPIHKKTYQNRVVNAGTGAKGNGGGINKPSTTRDPNQVGGSRYAK
jgi:hypothetical protein